VAEPRALELARAVADAAVMPVDLETSFPLGAISYSRCASVSSCRRAVERSDRHDAVTTHGDGISTRLSIVHRDDRGCGVDGDHRRRDLSGDG
jgi:hypothetical protein